MVFFVLCSGGATSPCRVVHSLMLMFRNINSVLVDLYTVIFVLCDDGVLGIVFWWSYYSVSCCPQPDADVP